MNTFVCKGLHILLIIVDEFFPEKLTIKFLRINRHRHQNLKLVVLRHTVMWLALIIHLQKIKKNCKYFNFPKIMQ